ALNGLENRIQISDTNRQIWTALPFALTRPPQMKLWCVSTHARIFAPRSANRRIFEFQREISSNAIRTEVTGSSQQTAPAWTATSREFAAITKRRRWAFLKKEHGLTCYWLMAIQ